MVEFVTEAVLARLRELQAAAGRLERRLTTDPPAGMLVCRAAVDIDHAAAVLADHADRWGQPATKGSKP